MASESDRVVVEELATVWRVTSGGYAAEVRKCTRDDCANGELTPCVRAYGHLSDSDAWTRHIKTHCHNWHGEKVEHLVQQMRVMGARRKATRSTTTPGRRAPLVEPGTRIEWTEWAEPPGATAVRAGVVWADGPQANSLWVQPDDDPTNPVAVRLPRPRGAQRGGHPALLAGYSATWQRDTIRRCDNLMRAGGVFGVIDHEDRWGKRISWHTDPQCPGIYETTARVDRDAAVYTAYATTKRKKAYVDYEGNPRTEQAGVVIDLLLSQRIGQTYLKEACRRCVFLVEPAQIGAVA